jgi:hypothetical protein
MEWALSQAWRRARRVLEGERPEPAARVVLEVYSLSMVRVKGG